jgi:hypothetical protein
MEKRMTYQITKGLPIPKISAGRPAIYPFAVLEVGDSFFSDNQGVANVRSAACAFARNHKVRFIVRKEGEGARCWRIE